MRSREGVSCGVCETVPMSSGLSLLAAGKIADYTQIRVVLLDLGEATYSSIDDNYTCERSNRVETETNFHKESYQSP